MNADTADVSSSGDAPRTDSRPVGFGASAALLAVAFVGAGTAGVLGTVGPYLLGVSALVVALFVLGRRTTW